MKKFWIPVGRLPDEALLSGLATGDAELAVTFVRRFQHKGFGVAITVTRNPQLAEDTSQQTFERAWRHAQIYDARRGSVDDVAYDHRAQLCHRRRPYTSAEPTMPTSALTW